MLFEKMKTYLLPYILKESCGFVIQAKFEKQYLLKHYVNDLILQGEVDKVRSLYKKIFLYQENIFLVNNIFDLDFNFMDNYIINDKNEIDIVDLGYLTDDMSQVQISMSQNLTLAKQILTDLNQNKKIEEHKIKFSSLGGQIAKYFRSFPEIVARQMSIIFLEEIILSRRRILNNMP